MKFEFSNEEINVLMNLLNIALKTVGDEAVEAYRHFKMKLKSPLPDKTMENLEEKKPLEAQ